MLKIKINILYPFVPIELGGSIGGGGGHSYNDFSEHFIKICEEYKKTGRTLIFAFICCDFETAEVNRMLHDSQYWNALHHLSGDLVTIFSILSPGIKVGYYTNVAVTQHKAQGYSEYREFSSASMDIVKKYFPEIAEYIQFPCVIFFQVNENETADHIVVGFETKKMDDLYHELRDVLQDVCDAIRFTHENRQNFSLAFTRAKERLSERRKEKIVIKFFQNIIMPIFKKKIGT